MGIEGRKNDDFSIIQAIGDDISGRNFTGAADIQHGDVGFNEIGKIKQPIFNFLSL